MSIIIYLALQSINLNMLQIGMKKSSSWGSLNDNAFIRPAKIESLAAANFLNKDLFEKLLDQSQIVNSGSQKSTLMEEEQKLILNENQPQLSVQQGCKCTKIDCLKLYCECFSKGKMCNLNCQCVCCHNKPTNPIQIIKAKQIANFRNPGFFKGVPQLIPVKRCTCKKSRCIKKYCQCYNSGLKCLEECECIDCHNGKPNLQMGIDSRIQIEVNG